MPRLSRYKFPPGVTTMTPAEFEAHKRATDQRLAADRLARAARYSEGRKAGPSAIIDTLAVGASHTFNQYTKTGQLSSATRGAYIRTGKRYTSALARDLLTGESVIGVTVTRTE